MDLSDTGYTDIITSVLKKSKTLDEHGFCCYGTRFQTRRLGLLSTHHKQSFIFAVSALEFLIKHYTKPELVSNIRAYLEGKHRRTKFSIGIIIAAAIYLNIRIEDTSLFDSRSNYHSRYIGDALVFPLQKDGGEENAKRY